MKRPVSILVLLLATASAAYAEHTNIRSHILGVVPVLKCPTADVIKRVEEACRTIGADYTYFPSVYGQGNCETWQPFLNPVITDPSDPDLVTYIINGQVTFGECIKNK